MFLESNGRLLANFKESKAVAKLSSMISRPEESPDELCLDAVEQILQPLFLLVSEHSQLFISLDANYQLYFSILVFGSVFSGFFRCLLCM